MGRIGVWCGSPEQARHVHTLIEVSPLHEPHLAHEASMNEEGRPPRRNRSRRRPDGGSRRVAARPAYARRRPDYATGGYSSIYSGPFPTDQDHPTEPLTLTQLQANTADRLPDLA